MTLESDDLISRLRSNDGPMERERVLQQLAELESRLKTAINGGQTPQAFDDLEAVRLAVVAGRDTLNRLNLAEVAPSGPLGR